MQSTFKACLALMCVFSMTASLASNSLYLANNECKQTLSSESAARKDHVQNRLLNQVLFINKDETTVSLVERMQALNIPTASITTIKNNTIDWSAAYGNLSSDSDIKADCKTLFQSASLSKPVTMLAVLLMGDKGKVDLDLDIDTYLTSYELPAGKQTKEKPVTFRNILTHTSGLTPGGYMGYPQSEEIPTDVQVLNASGNVNSPKVEVQNEPGEQLMYSGGGYTLAELALQDIYKQSFEDIMNEWLLSPVGMSHSDFSQPLNTKKYTNVAKAHDGSGKVVEGGWHNHPEQAAAGLWSTSSDLAQFLIEIGKGYRGESKVFSKQLINTVLSNPISQHAYGFRLMGEGESLAIVHYGRNVGYVTGMVLNLVSGDGAVILTNSDNGFNFMNEALLTISNEYGWDHYKQTEMEQTSIPIDTLKTFTGEYKFLEQGWQIKVQFNEQSNQLALVFPNNDRYLLVPTTKGDYHLVHPETGVETSFEVVEEDTLIRLYGQVGTRQ